MPTILPPDPPPTVPADTGTTATAGDRLYARLAPIAVYDPDNGMVLRALTETLAEPQQIVDDVARDTATQTAWQPLTDPDTTPAIMLPWLAQFPGVQLQPSDTVAQWRARIKGAAGFYRGTPRATIEEVQAILDPATPRTVMIVANDPDFWHYTVGTRTAETPNPGLVVREVAGQKPAGMFTHAYTVGALSLLEFEATVIAHRALIGGADTYVPDPAGGTIGDFEAVAGTIASWEAGP